MLKNADPYARPHLHKGHHTERTHIEPFLGPHLRKRHHTERTNTTQFVRAQFLKTSNDSLKNKFNVTTFKLEAERRRANID